MKLKKNTSGIPQIKFSQKRKRIRRRKKENKTESKSEKKITKEVRKEFFNVIMIKERQRK